MKKLVKILALGAFVMAAVLSCTKDEKFAPDTENNGKISLTFLADNQLTKTILGENNSVSWNTAEGSEWAEFIQVANGNHSNQGVAATVADGKATFTLTFDEVAGATEYKYYSYYPTTSWRSDLNDITKAVLGTPNSQNINDLSTYDAAADLLVAKPVVKSAPVSADPNLLQFTRLVTLGKITIKGLPEGCEAVTGINIASEGKAFAGSTTVNLETAEVVNAYGDVESSDNIQMNINKTLNFGNNSTAIFTCYPEELAAGDKLTVTVMAGTRVFKKVIDLGAKLSFELGKVATFTVDMTGTEQVAAKGIYVLDVTGWGQPDRAFHIWVKETGSPITGGWPGTAPETRVVNGKTYCYYQFPSDLAEDKEIGVIFNEAGKGGQSGDTFIYPDKDYFFAAFNDQVPLAEIKTCNLYLKDESSWGENIHVYTFLKGTGYNFTGGWPGTKITETKNVSGEDYRYLSFEYYNRTPALQLGIILNNANGEQTPDTFVDITDDLYIRLKSDKTIEVL